MSPVAAVFAAAAFVNAFLLFLVQPMFARLVLPLLGGSAAVWTTCMLFFQTALLAGYLYSHASIRWLGVRRQSIVHLTLLALPMAVLPIGVAADASGAAESPVAWVLRLSTVSVGLPFFVLATSAPLLQRWFAATSHGRCMDPYVLYAASNAGSLGALLLYPSVVEPLLALTTQSAVWAVGYGLATLLTWTCAVTLWRSPREEPAHGIREPGAAPPHMDRRSLAADDDGSGVVRVPVDPPAANTRGPAADDGHHVPSRGPQPEALGPEPAADRRHAVLRTALWVSLSAVPSSLMLAVTAYLSTDVAPVPLLWVVPLAIYLLTFILTFSGSRDRAVGACRRLLPYAIILLLWLLVTGTRLPATAMVGSHLLGFFVLATLCHGVLSADRPPASQLTGFYLWLSVGGAAGGVFNTVVAPRVFTDVSEYPAALAAGCLLLGLPAAARRLRAPSAWIRPAAAAALAVGTMLVVDNGRFLEPAPLALLGLAMLAVFSTSRDPASFGVAVALVVAVNAALGDLGWGTLRHASRTFFGVYRVGVEPTGRFITLYHGVTVHGRQRVGEPMPEPLTYYNAESPIADVLTRRPGARIELVGAVGLGIGTLAAYATSGQRWTFYEIDPEVERIARDVRLFSHLAACGAACDVVIGDARLSLAGSRAVHDVIVLDAFSSDAIPVHLLTREALGVYLARLAPDGVLAFHISNNHLRLRPVLARLGAAHGLSGRARFDAARAGRDRGWTASHWVALARTPEALGTLWTDERWEPLVAEEGPLWTDDFSNIWSVMRWR